MSSATTATSSSSALPRESSRSASRVETCQLVLQEDDADAAKIIERGLRRDWVARQVHKDGRERAERALLDEGPKDASGSFTVPRRVVSSGPDARRVRKAHEDKPKLAAAAAAPKDGAARDIHSVGWGQDADDAPDEPTAGDGADLPESSRRADKTGRGERRGPRRGSSAERRAKVDLPRRPGRGDAATWISSAETSRDAESSVADRRAALRYLKRDKGFMEYGGEIASTLKDDEKNAKDAKLHERLETKLRKLNAARRDNQRLLTKEGGLAGLAEGQRRAFDSNDARISKLTDEISDLEETIRGRGKQRDESRRSQEDREEAFLFEKQARDDDAGDDDGDLRDHTTKLPRARTAEEKAARRRQRFAAPAAPARASTAAPTPLAEARPDEDLSYEALSAKRVRGRASRRRDFRGDAAERSRNGAAEVGLRARRCG